MHEKTIPFTVIAMGNIKFLEQRLIPNRRQMNFRKSHNLSWVAFDSIIFTYV